MLAVVLRYRTKMWFRSLRLRSGRLRASPGTAAALYLLVLLFIAAYSAAITTTVRDTSPENESGLLFVPLAGIVFMTLLGGVSVSLNELFVTTDVELLLTTPISGLNLYLLKLLDCSLPAWPTIGWWLSPLVAYGWVLGLGWGFMVAALLTAVLLAAVVVAFDVVIVLLVARVVPARRLREAVVVVSGIAGVSAWLLWYASGARGGRANVAGQLASLDARFRWTPIGWAYQALSHAQTGDIGLVLAGLAVLALLALVVVLCGYVLFERVFLAGWSATQESRSGRRRRARRAPASSGASPVAVAVALKDWRTLRRDVSYLGSLLPTFIYAIFYPFLLLRFPTGGTLAGRWIGLAGLALVPLMAASTLALTAIGREGIAFEVLRASPLRPTRLFAGKVLLVGLPIGLVTVGAGLGLAAYHHAPLPAFIVAVVGGAWLALGCSAIGVGAGAISPDFTAKPSRRAQAVRGPGCFVYLAAAGSFGLMSTLAVVALVVVALNHLNGRAVALALVFSFLAIDVALVAVGAIAVIGVQRLANLLGPEQ